MTLFYYEIRRNFFFLHPSLPSILLFILSMPRSLSLTLFMIGSLIFCIVHFKLPIDRWIFNLLEIPSTKAFSTCPFFVNLIYQHRGRIRKNLRAHRNMTINIATASLFTFFFTLALSISHSLSFILTNRFTFGNGTKHVQ